MNKVKKKQKAYKIILNNLNMSQKGIECFLECIIHSIYFFLLPLIIWLSEATSLIISIIYSSTFDIKCFVLIICYS